jgi:hypothetical protein
MFDPVSRSTFQKLENVLYIIFFTFYIPRRQKERTAFQKAQIFEKIFPFFDGVLAPLDPTQRFLNAMLRIRDIYPADHNCFHPGSGFFYTESLRIPDLGSQRIMGGGGG